MAWSLNFSGGAIQIPKITFTGDFSITMSATQVVNGRFFFGGDTTSGSIEVYRNNSGFLSLFIATAGQFSGATALSSNVNTPDTVLVSRSGSSVTVHVNGVLQGTTTFSGSMHVTLFGLRQGWTNYPAPMRLYYCNMQDITTPSNSRYYDPSLSGGTGSTLPTAAGTNPGTQINSWPNDNSEWVYYASGADNTVTVASSLPKLTASVTLSRIDSSQATVSGTLPKLTGSIALQSQAPIRTASINGQLPKLTGSIALASIAPANQIAISGLLPRLTGSVSLVSSQPPIAALVNGTLPRFTASIQLNIPGVYPEADANDFTVSAMVDSSFSFESRLSPTVGFSAIISSTFKYNGSLN